MPQKQLPLSTNPPKKSQCRRSVEPGNVRAASEPAVGSAGSPVMRAMKWQVPLERQMEVHRAGQKRKNAQRKAYKEAEKIKIRPGHGTPRPHLLPQLKFAT